MGKNEATAREEQVDGSEDINASEWWKVAKLTWSEAGEDNLSLIASGIAFNGFFALIPLLTAVVLSYGLFASPAQIAGHIAALAAALPQEAAAIIGDQLQNMVQSDRTATGFGLLFSLGILLFSALRGAAGIIIALNIVYGVSESRSFVRQTGVALTITIGLVVLFSLSSVAISVVNMLSNLLPDLGGASQSALQIGFWIAATAAGCMIIALIYAYAPNREESEWPWLTPGSFIATAVWFAATFGFSFYVRNFGSYNATYGALGAVIIFLTWLYLSAYILLLGAELNQVLSRRDSNREAKSGI